MAGINTFHSCHNCTDRRVGCHSTCDKYIQEKAQHDEAIEQYKASLNPIIHGGCFLGDSGFRKRHKYHKY